MVLSVVEDGTRSFPVGQKAGGRNEYPSDLYYKTPYTRIRIQKYKDILICYDDCKQMSSMREHTGESAGNGCLLSIKLHGIFSGVRLLEDVFDLFQGQALSLDHKKVDY